jgi:hypothetical protein
VKDIEEAKKVKKAKHSKAKQSKKVTVLLYIYVFFFWGPRG